MAAATDFTVIKRLSFAFGVTPENQDLERSIDHGQPLFVTSPWYDVIAVAPSVLANADPEYIKMETFDKYHGRIHFKVANGEAHYNMTYDVVEALWVGRLIAANGGGEED